MGSSMARRRFVQPLRRILLSSLHLVLPAGLSEPAFKSGACDLCALEVMDRITVTPLCVVDETGIDLWITDYIGYPGCRDFDPSHSICAEESLLPCSAIVDSEPDLASAACTSDIGSPRA